MQTEEPEAHLVPVGAIIAYAGDAESQRDELRRAGWLLCDGEPLSQSEYAELFDKIRMAFGAPEEGGLFNLPDLRGLFIRGVSNDTDRDPDKNARSLLRHGGNIGNEVGSYQEYATGSPKDAFRATIPNAMIGDRSLDAGCDVSDAGRYRGGDGTGRTDGSGGDLETRPINKYVYYLIKYKVYDEVREPVDLPIGSVSAYAGKPSQALQQNWVLCDGGAQSATGEFKDLYAAIGTANGQPSEGQFNLPDFQGYFLRGVSMGVEGRDPDVSSRSAAKPGGNSGDKVGSQQGDATAYPVSDDFITTIPHLPESSGDPAITGAAKDVFTWNGGTVRGVDVAQDGGDHETRPINMSVAYYVRFR